MKSVCENEVIGVRRGGRSRKNWIDNVRKIWEKLTGASRGEIMYGGVL